MGGRECREDERERNIEMRDTSIGYFLHAPPPELGIKSAAQAATQARALDWKSSPRPFGAWTSALTEPHQQGHTPYVFPWYLLFDS